MSSHLDRHRVLAGATRARILDSLRRSPGQRGVRALADELGLHPNSVREQLDILVAAGMVTVEAERPVGRGRPSLLYRALPGAGEPDARHYRDLARLLVEDVAARPDAEVAAVAAGERWGRALASDDRTRSDDLGALISILDRTGFAPDPQPDEQAPIRLRRCPYADLAKDRAEVVCGIHLGLMRGALRARRASFDVLSLEPFVAPDLCLAHLGDTTRD
jgi:predicted ArsR family transcriptional regulator